MFLVSVIRSPRYQRNAAYTSGNDGGRAFEHRTSSVTQSEEDAPYLRRVFIDARANNRVTEVVVVFFV